MDLDAAIDAEAEAQAICMETEDFRWAYRAFRRQAEARVRRQLTMHEHLDWPFFDAAHRAFADTLQAWIQRACSRGR